MVVGPINRHISGVADQTGAPPCSGAPPLTPLPPGDASGGSQPPELGGAPPPPAAAPEKRQMSAQPAHQGPVWQATAYHPWQQGWPSATVTTSQVVTSPPQQSADADDAPVICEIGQMKSPARWPGAAVKSVTTAAPVVVTTARSEAPPAPSPARTAAAAPSATRPVAKVAPPSVVGHATSAPSPVGPATTAPGPATSAPPASKPATIAPSLESAPSTLPPPTSRSGPQSEAVAPPVRTARPKEAPVTSPPQGTPSTERAAQASHSAVRREKQATRGMDQSQTPPAHEIALSQPVPARTSEQQRATPTATATSVATSADVSAARSSPASGSAARSRPGAVATTSSTPASTAGPGFNYLAVAAMPQCPPRHRRPILPRPFPGMSRPSVTSSTLMTSSLVSGAQVMTSPLGQMVVERSEYRAQLVAPPVRVFAENQVQIVELPNNAGSKVNVSSDTRPDAGVQLSSIGPAASSEPQLSQADCGARVEGRQAETDGDRSSEPARRLASLEAVAQPKKENTSLADKPTLKRKDVEVKQEPPAKKAKTESLDGAMTDAKVKMRPVFKTTAAKREHDHLKTGVKSEKPKSSPIVSKVSTDNYSKTIDMVAKAKFKPSTISPAEKKKTKPKAEKALNLVTSTTTTTNGEKSQSPKKRGRPKKLERSASESGSCTSEASSAASSRSNKSKKHKSSADISASTQSNGTAKTPKEHRRKSSTDRLIVDVASLCGRRTPTDLKSRLSAPPPRLTDSPAPDAVRPKPRRPETEPGAAGATGATGAIAAVRHKPRRPRVVPGLTARKSISPDLPAAEETAPAAARPPASRRGRRPSSGSTGAERKRKRRQDRQPSGEGRLIIPRPVGGQRWSHAWSFQGEGQMKKILLRNDGQLVERLCYPSMRHQEGDEIALRDCVLLRAGGRDEMPFVGKVAAIFQNPEDNEMLVSLLWYYRPDSTDYGEGEVPVDADKTRPPNNGVQSSSPAEVFASRHRDTNSVACIEDKCFVLTWNEYCRYTKFLALYQAGLPSYSSQVPESPAEYPRMAMLPPARVAPDRVFFCKRVYDYRTKRILKNPMPAPANGN